MVLLHGEVRMLKPKCFELLFRLERMGVGFIGACTEFHGGNSRFSTLLIAEKGLELLHESLCDELSSLGIWIEHGEFE